MDNWLDSLIAIEEIVQTEMKLGKRKGVTRERIGRWHASKQIDGTHQTSTGPTKVASTGVTLLPKQKMASPAAPVLAQPIERKRFVALIEERVDVNGSPSAYEVETNND